MTLGIAIGPRLAKSPFFDSTVAAGASRFTVYNHTLLPVSYGDPDGEYWRLIEGVSMWDVSVQRQVEVAGPDAAELVQAVVCRDLSKTVPGQAKYAPMVDHAGRLMNDPLVLRVEEDRWWLSLADSDMVFWCRAIAAERRLNAAVSLPDVSTLAVQGPGSPEVVSDLLGDWARGLGFFRFRRGEVGGIPLLVGRAGWSGQDGYELCLLDGGRGAELWRLVAEAGRPHGIGPGAPNPAERIESNMFSYGSDAPADADPFEARLERFVDLDRGVEFIGRDALVDKRAGGLRRRLAGVWIEGDPLPCAAEHPWPAMAGGRVVGAVRAAVHSPRLRRNIGLAFVEVPHNAAGTRLEVDAPGGRVSAEVADLPFIAPQRPPKPAEPRAS